MRESRSSGSVEGVMGNHDSYSDFGQHQAAARKQGCANSWEIGETTADTANTRGVFLPYPPEAD